MLSLPSRGLNQQMCFFSLKRHWTISFLFFGPFWPCNSFANHRQNVLFNKMYSEWVFVLKNTGHRQLGLSSPLRREVFFLLRSCYFSAVANFSFWMTRNRLISRLVLFMTLNVSISMVFITNQFVPISMMAPYFKYRPATLMNAKTIVWIIFKSLSLRLSRR